jgi:hypothetical protein
MHRRVGTPEPQGRPARVARIWTDTQGRSIEATLLAIEGDTLLMRRTVDQRVFRLPLDRLSQADRDWVAAQEF